MSVNTDQALADLKALNKEQSEIYRRASDAKEVARAQAERAQEQLQRASEESYREYRKLTAIEAAIDALTDVKVKK